MKARLLSWNLAGRVRRLAEQAELVIATRADVICLQEVTASTERRWREALGDAGYAHAALAAADVQRPAARRPLSVLTAARRPLSTIEIDDLPWPERALATTIDGLHLVNAHSPISPSPGLAKVRTHEALHAHLRGASGPRALCGDLNTPRKEHPDGSVWTFARTRYGKLRPERGERWDAAELGLIKGLEPEGFRDAFRALYGYEVRALSWEWQRSGGGYRLDHLIVSSEVQVSRMAYVREWRRAGLSDHSPLVAEITW